MIPIINDTKVIKFGSILLLSRLKIINKIPKW